MPTAIMVRPYGGRTSVEPHGHFDVRTFDPPLRQMNGLPFTHITVTDHGQPGRRQCLSFHTSLEVAQRAAVKSTRIYGSQPRPGTVWIEILP